MTNRFTDELRRRVDPIWEAQHQHPFVQGVGDGTLNVETFKYWVRQDYAYLIDYARLLALAAARAPDADTMARFAELAQLTLQTEMRLHRSYAEEFGISAAQLEAEQKSPTCQAYCDFLLRTATLGDFGELVSALLPCFWGYSEIGRRLAQQQRSSDPRYGKWIDMYAADSFKDLAEWCRDLLDRLAATGSDAYRQRLEDTFVLSSRYELAFWEMAWHQEAWP
jgi:thiaminase/transcriptional activator TenA